MSKATILADLYQKSVQEYTKTPAEWKGLLSCVARFYKRSFDNAVLIYAQKPNATQLGAFDKWHDERIGRSINKGTKSIAVIDMQNPNASLKCLFDFMDTNGTEQSFRNFMRYHWELEEQYRPSLMLRFHDKYAVPTTSIEACLYKLVSRRVAQILPKYMENFKVRAPFPDSMDTKTIVIMERKKGERKWKQNEKRASYRHDTTRRSRPGR